MRWALWVIFATACLPERTPASGARDLEVPLGAKLETTCVPTGFERCFDAVDDNCNGIIDEGCGIHTGVLQFVAAWDVPEADIDLEVTDPSGEIPAVGSPTSQNFIKDRDCLPGGLARSERTGLPHASVGCGGRNVENVYAADGVPPTGRYQVTVKLNSVPAGSAPIPVRLGIRIGESTMSLSFSLSAHQGERSKTFEFTL